jgi:hypothetical protein
LLELPEELLCELLTGWPLADGRPRPFIDPGDQQGVGQLIDQTPTDERWRRLG